MADAFVVDIMLNANGQTYETLLPYIQVIEVDGIPVRTVSLEGLLLTKRTQRAKDQDDCRVIERALAALEAERRIQRPDTPANPPGR